MVPAFEAKLQELIDILWHEHNNVIIVLQGDVDVEQQARLWAQSRTSLERDRSADYLDAQGAPGLGAVLRGVRAACGRWASNHLPGASWQQFGEGALIVAVEGDRTNWRRSDDVYRNIATVADSIGLHSGAHYALPDPCLISLKRVSPIRALGWPRIDQLLTQRNGGGSGTLDYSSGSRGMNQPLSSS